MYQAPLCSSCKQPYFARDPWLVTLAHCQQYWKRGEPRGHTLRACHASSFYESTYNCCIHVFCAGWRHRGKLSEAERPYHHRPNKPQIRKWEPKRAVNRWKKVWVYHLGRRMGWGVLEQQTNDQQMLGLMASSRLFRDCCLPKSSMHVLRLWMTIMVVLAFGTMNLD